MARLRRRRPGGKRCLQHYVVVNARFPEVLAQELAADSRATDAEVLITAIVGAAHRAHARIRASRSVSSAPTPQQSAAVCIRAFRMKREGRELQTVQLASEFPRAAVALRDAKMDSSEFGAVLQTALDGAIRTDLVGDHSDIPEMSKTAKPQCRRMKGDQYRPRHKRLVCDAVDDAEGEVIMSDSDVVDAIRAEWGPVFFRTRSGPCRASALCELPAERRGGGVLQVA